MKKEAGSNGENFVVHRRREGHCARYQHERRLDAIATPFDRYREDGSRISQDAPLSNALIV